MATATRVLQLDCAVQTYAWGKPGSQSEVAKLSKCGNKNFHLDEEKPYAELWMGTHPKGPSVITETGQPLLEWMTRNPDCLGQKIRDTFGKDDIPYLLKVLSVNKSLSIQAHPTKAHAEELHQKDPSNYPDDNHKPEMAIALTPFQGLCGFRPKEEISQFLQNIPELRAVIGEEAAKEFISAPNENATESALQQCFTSLMTCDPSKVAAQLSSLVKRLTDAGREGQDTTTSQGELLLRLNSQFPGDVGCFCSYLLNHMTMCPGEAMFLAANLPHAYLSGDCIECMACSDNVVRAGLTPKFMDVPTLCSMLNYSCKPAKDNLFPSKPDSGDPYVHIYDPPVEDFMVARIQVPEGVTQYTLSAVSSASILLVVQGEAKGHNSTLGNQAIQLKRGNVLFVSANQSVDLTDISKSLLLFRAYC